MFFHVVCYHGDTISHEILSQATLFHFRQHFTGWCRKILSQKLFRQHFMDSYLILCEILSLRQYYTENYVAATHFHSDIITYDTGIVMRP